MSAERDKHTGRKCHKRNKNLMRPFFKRRAFSTPYNHVCNTGNCVTRWRVIVHLYGAFDTLFLYYVLIYSSASLKAFYYSHAFSVPRVLVLQHGCLWQRGEVTLYCESVFTTLLLQLTWTGLNSPSFGCFHSTCLWRAFLRVFVPCLPDRHREQCIHSFDRCTK